MKKKTNLLLIILIIVILIACCFIGYKLYKDNQIKQMRNDCITSIESKVVLEDYRDKEKNIVVNYIDSGKDTINTLKNKSEMDAVVESTLKNISKVKTKEILEKERKKKEAEERAAAEAQAQNSQNSPSNSGSQGCVGSGAENFY